MARKKTTPTKKAQAKTKEEEQPKALEEETPSVLPDGTVDAPEVTDPPVNEADAATPDEETPNEADTQADSAKDDEKATAVKPEVSRDTKVQVKTADGIRTAVLGSKAIFAGQVHTVAYGVYRNSFAPGKFLVRYPDSQEFVAETEL